MLLGLTFRGWGGGAWVERQETNMGGRAGMAVGTEHCGEREGSHGGVDFEQEPGGERW